MTSDELNKLQRYIGKRPQGQSKEQVMEHIERIDKKDPLSKEEWCKLLFPVCANGDIAMLDFLDKKLSLMITFVHYCSETDNFRSIGWLFNLL